MPYKLPMFNNGLKTGLDSYPWIEEKKYIDIYTKKIGQAVTLAQTGLIVGLK